ncbi:MAG: arginase [Deinococcales bacterium]|nr:arginase [Deinococcales bacterium]
MAEVRVLGVPMDLGAGRRGVDMGPSALRVAHLAATLRELGHEVVDLGNVDAPVAEATDGLEAAGPERRGLAHFADAIAATCAAAYRQLAALPAEAFVITLGGDHSISMGTVAGLARGERTGVIWVDAHADLNTPDSSPSGNVHGMPVAHLLGLGDERFRAMWGGGAAILPEDLVYIGLRSVDPPERELIHELGLRAFTMKEVDQLGIARVAAEAVERLSGLARVHVSFDADALDPAVAPGVGTPVPGGLTYREAHLLMELLADAGLATSLDLVEVNPTLDRGNRTARTLVEMAASLLGKRIL